MRWRPTTARSPRCASACCPLRMPWRACICGCADTGGASVGFCARTSADVVRAAEEMTGRGDGVTVTGRCVDVSDRAGVSQWVSDTATELGGLDIVVANVSALAIPDEEANWQAG